MSWYIKLFKYCYVGTFALIILENETHHYHIVKLVLAINLRKGNPNLFFRPQ